MADTRLEAHRIASAARPQGLDELTADELRIIDRLHADTLTRARIDNQSGTRVDSHWWLEAAIRA